PPPQPSPPSPPGPPAPPITKLWLTVLSLTVTTRPKSKRWNASRPPPQARPPFWPAPPVPAIAGVCSIVQPLIGTVPPAGWVAPPAARLGRRGLDGGLLLWFPLPPMAWLWSNVLALTTSLLVPVAGFPPLTMAPPAAKPVLITLELSLPPIAWLWLKVLLVTVRLRLLKMAPPTAGMSRVPVQSLPARATLWVNCLPRMLTVARLVMAPPLAPPTEVPILWATV